MFMFDVETLSTESTTVILSAAIIYFDPAEQPDYQKLLDDACFVKLNAKDQIQRLDRTVSKDTLNWWKEQHQYARAVSFDSNKDEDIPAELAVEILQRYVDKYDPNHEHTIWARGSLDQMSIDSLTNKLGLQPIMPYNKWRDVRTAIDCFTGSTNGYCNVDHPTFLREDVIKHHPVHDCALDAMMLMYGTA